MGIGRLMRTHPNTMANGMGRLTRIPALRDTSTDQAIEFRKAGAIA